MYRNIDNIYLIDTEFSEQPGETPTPLCAVSKNIITGEVRTWTMHQPVGAPIYTTGERDLVVAYAAEAEGKCFQKLGWPRPRNCLDLYPIFRCLTNRFGERNPASLLSALNYFNLAGMASVEKEEMHKLAQRGGSYSREEMSALVKYCRTDVEALESLLPMLWGRLSLQHALLMGRYSMTAVTSMQSAGIPLEHNLLRRIISSKDDILGRLIAQVDADFGVYSDGSFNHRKFQSYVSRQSIPWPKTTTGMLCVDEKTFKTFAQIYPQMAPLAELRKTIAAFRNIQPSTGADGRNRTSVRPYASITGRNQPSTATNVYSWPKWLRHLIRPSAGRAIITLDFGQQEFLIGAALSRDAQMIAAYRSGDPYLATAINSGHVGEGATRDSHPFERERFKIAALSIQYQCTPHGLAPRVGGYSMANKLIEDHQFLYPTYHKWSMGQIDRVMLGSPLTTPLGWTVSKGALSSAFALKHKLRSIANWSVQATGSDILLIATIALVEHGFCVIAPVHDAIVLECDVDVIEDVVREAKKHMQLACQVVLGGETCRVDVKITLPTNDILAGPMPDMLRRIVSLLPKEVTRYA